MLKSETIDSIAKKWTCEMAIEKNLTRCPLKEIPDKFYGTLTLKFENGVIVADELTRKRLHGR
jgi:hypothetical protein